MPIKSLLENQFAKTKTDCSNLGFYLRKSRQSLKLVDIELSERCNLRCRMCWLYGKNGLGDKYSDNEMTTNEVIDLINQAAVYGSDIYIGGSEPFIRKDLPAILRHIKEKRLSVSFTTNGTLLGASEAEMLVNLGVDAVNISIDGDEELHDRLRGRGVYRKAVSALTELRRCRDRSRKTRPLIYINMTVSADILGRIEQAMRSVMEATNDSPDFYRLHHLWYITGTELLERQRSVNQILHCSAPGAACHLLSDSDRIDPTLISKEIASLKKFPKISMFPRLSEKEVFQYYSENAASKKKRCLAPFFSAVVKPNGDVRFCPDEWIDDYVIGNVRRERLEEIWNSSSANHFRTNLQKCKSFAGCIRCSSMYHSD